MTGEANSAVEFYFNTRTKMVEQGRLSAWEHLMGPYDSREQAQAALATAQERNDAWDEQDEEWDDD